MFSYTYGKPLAASDSATITRGDHNLKRALLFKFLGVAPNPSVSVITEAGALHATLGGNDNYMLLCAVLCSQI